MKKFHWPLPTILEVGYKWTRCVLNIRMHFIPNGMKFYKISIYCSATGIIPREWRHTLIVIGVLLTDEEFWQEQRRFVLQHLKEFGFGRRTMAELVEEEARQLVQAFQKRLEGSQVGRMALLLPEDIKRSPHLCTFSSATADNNNIATARTSKEVT